MEETIRILIVNDEQVVRMATSHILHQAGYEILEASSGAECLHIARAEKPHLVLLDVVMPGMDGIETCREIKANPELAGILVILFSSSRIHSKDQVEGLNLGADGYITYPCSREELFARIEAYVRIQKSEQRLREIEERKRSEEQLRKSKVMLQRVFDGISEPLIMLGPDMRVHMVNKAAKDYYRLARYTDAIGKHCYEGLKGRSVPCEECERPFASLKGYVGAFERKGAMDPDRVEQIVVYSARDELEGEDDATIIRISDITKAKLMERQLIQSEKLASIGLLVSGIAHEINNPNSFILINIPILRDYLAELLPIVDSYAKDHPDFELFFMPYEELRQDIFKLLENMEHGSNRINATVSGLKEFARKREKSERQLVNMEQAAERAVILCRAELRKRIKSFDVSIEEGMPPLFADPEAIEQVIVNLLINAAHASDKEESWVKLRIFEGDGGLKPCIIEVSDNGCGMDEKTLANIFNPFFTTKSSLQGTGLGLYICHNLVESQGGKVVVESKQGIGSTFRVILYHVS
jgi:signal transduction histidine kinase/DNA-binding NarL/FixJ family response regulator